jgi:hypothetical protein
VSDEAKLGMPLVPVRFRSGIIWDSSQNMPAIMPMSGENKAGVIRMLYLKRAVEHLQLQRKIFPILELVILTSVDNSSSGVYVEKLKLFHVTDKPQYIDFWRCFIKLIYLEIHTFINYHSDQNIFLSFHQPQNSCFDRY